MDAHFLVFARRRDREFRGEQPGILRRSDYVLYTRKTIFYTCVRARTSMSCDISYATGYNEFLLIYASCLFYVDGKNSPGHFGLFSRRETTFFLSSTRRRRGNSRQSADTPLLMLLSLSFARFIGRVSSNTLVQCQVEMRRVHSNAATFDSSDYVEVTNYSVHSRLQSPTHTHRESSFRSSCTIIPEINGPLKNCWNYFFFSGTETSASVFRAKINFKIRKSHFSDTYLRYFHTWRIISRLRPPIESQRAERRSC